MKPVQINPIYCSSFDGHILKYEASALSKVFLNLFGLSVKVEIPVNIVLKYRKSRGLLGLTLLRLTIERYRFGHDRPNPVRIPAILFIGGKKRLLTPMLSEIDNCIEESKRGTNVGLLHLNRKSLRFFYLRAEPESRVYDSMPSDVQVHEHITIQHLGFEEPREDYRKKTISI